MLCRHSGNVRGIVADTKYRQIADELLADITAGRFQPTGRLPSETQLVRRFDVSRPTAARALRELQNQGLIERRAGSGTFVRQQAAVVEEGQRVIGLLAPEIGSTEILEVICGDIARLARLHDCALLWGREGVHPNVNEAFADPTNAQSVTVGADPIEASRQLCDAFIQRSVPGVFFVPLEHHPDSQNLNFRITDRLRQAGIAVVLVDRDIHPFPQRSEFDLVGIDNFAAGFTAASHLLKLGCNGLLFLAPPQTAPTIAQRIAGAREAVISQEPSARPLQVARFEPDDVDEIEKLIARFRLVADASVADARDPLDAIICSNDRVAATLMQTLAKLGIEVPRDIRLIGFDDVKYAQLLTVPLTTIRQPYRDIAMVAFRSMLDCIEKVVVPPRQYLLASQLIVRESCGAYMKPQPM